MTKGWEVRWNGFGGTVEGGSGEIGGGDVEGGWRGRWRAGGGGVEG